MRIPPLGLIMHSCINFPSLLSPALPTLCSLANCCQLLTYFADWPHCCCWRPHSPAASSPPHCSSLLRSGGSTTVPSNDADWCRSRHHVKSPRVSRNCCLLRPFAKAAGRPTSVQQERPALWWPARSCTSPNPRTSSDCRPMLLYVTNRLVYLSFANR